MVATSVHITPPIPVGTPPVLPPAPVDNAEAPSRSSAVYAPSNGTGFQHNIVPMPQMFQTPSPSMVFPSMGQFAPLYLVVPSAALQNGTVQFVTHNQQAYVMLDHSQQQPQQQHQQAEAPTMMMPVFIPPEQMVAPPTAPAPHATVIPPLKAPCAVSASPTAGPIPAPHPVECNGLSECGTSSSSLFGESGCNTPGSVTPTKGKAKVPRTHMPKIEMLPKSVAAVDTQVCPIDAELAGSLFRLMDD